MFDMVLSMSVNVHGSSFNAFSVDFQQVFANRIHILTDEIYVKLTSHLTFTCSKKKQWNHQNNS